MLLGYSNITASTVIFSDGFEAGFSNWTGNDEKWATSGTSVANGIKSGEKRAEVKGNTEPGDDVLLKSVSTSGSEGIVLEFWYRIKESLEDEDHVYIEWTDDGSSWNSLKDFTAIAKSDAWALASYPLPASADNNPTFAIRFRAHLGAASSDIFYLDDVAISANGGSLETPIPTPTSASTPTPISTPTPTPTPIPTPTPMASLEPTGTPLPTFEPQTSSTSTPQLPAISAVPTPTVNPSKNPVSGSSKTISVNTTQDSLQTAVGSEPLSASIVSRFAGSKSFWLMGLMAMAVVFSMAKFKKD